MESWSRSIVQGLMEEEEYHIRDKVTAVRCGGNQETKKCHGNQKREKRAMALNDRERSSKIRVSGKILLNAL
jgi:hypothetical protein